MKKKIITILMLVLFITTILPVIEAKDKPFENKITNLAMDTSLSDQIVLEKIYKDSKPLTTYAEVYTNKFLYHKGETVAYTIYNIGDSWITLGGPPMGEILKFYFIGFQWQRVYPYMWHMMIRWISPGSSETETWNQRDINGNQVPSGIYRVDAWYTESSPPPSSSKIMQQHTCSDYFIII